MTERTQQEMKAYRGGTAARKRGLPRHSNPHHCATNAAADKYWAWFAGWDEQPADASSQQQVEPK